MTALSGSTEFFLDYGLKIYTLNFFFSSRSIETVILFKVLIIRIVKFRSSTVLKLSVNKLINSIYLFDM